MGVASGSLRDHNPSTGPMDRDLGAPRGLLGALLVASWCPCCFQSLKIGCPTPFRCKSMLSTGLRSSKDHPQLALRAPKMTISISISLSLSISILILRLKARFFLRKTECVTWAPSRELLVALLLVFSCLKVLQSSRMTSPAPISDIGRSMVG